MDHINISVMMFPSPGPDVRHLQLLAQPPRRPGLQLPQLQQPGVPREQQPGNLGVACRYMIVKLDASMGDFLPTRMC